MTEPRLLADSAQDPTASSKINGQWKLLYTSRPGTSSPIQRTFTGVESFTVFQEVYLDREYSARINNCVDFGEDVRPTRQPDCCPLDAHSAVLQIAYCCCCCCVIIAGAAIAGWSIASHSKEVVRIAAWY